MAEIEFEQESKTAKAGRILFDTAEKRRQLCRDWCEHLADGFSRNSFPYCDQATFQSYVKRYPDDFDPVALRRADAEQQLAWERRLGHLADTDEGNAQATIFGLKNIAGWREKYEVDQTVDSKVESKIEIEVSAVDKFASVLDQFAQNTGGGNADPE